MKCVVSFVWGESRIENREGEACKLYETNSLSFYLDGINVYIQIEVLSS